MNVEDPRTLRSRTGLLNVAASRLAECGSEPTLKDRTSHNAGRAGYRIET